MSYQIGIEQYPEIQRQVEQFITQKRSSNPIAPLFSNTPFDANGTPIRSFYKFYVVTSNLKHRKSFNGIRVGEKDYGKPTLVVVHLKLIAKSKVSISNFTDFGISSTGGVEIEIVNSALNYDRVIAHLVNMLRIGGEVDEGDWMGLARSDFFKLFRDPQDYNEELNQNELQHHPFKDEINMALGQMARQGDTIEKYFAAWNASISSGLTYENTGFGEYTDPEGIAKGIDRIIQVMSDSHEQLTVRVANANFVLHRAKGDADVYAAFKNVHQYIRKNLFLRNPADGFRCGSPDENAKQIRNYGFLASLATAQSYLNVFVTYVALQSIAVLEYFSLGTFMYVTNPYLYWLSPIAGPIAAFVSGSDTVIKLLNKLCKLKIMKGCLPKGKERMLLLAIKIAFGLACIIAFAYVFVLLSSYRVVTKNTKCYESFLEKDCDTSILDMLCENKNGLLACVTKCKEETLELKMEEAVVSDGLLLGFKSFSQKPLEGEVGSTLTQNIVFGGLDHVSTNLSSTWFTALLFAFGANLCLLLQ